MVASHGDVDQVLDSDGFVAMGADAAWADAAAGAVAVGAPLLAEVALFAVVAGVDGGVSVAG